MLKDADSSPLPTVPAANTLTMASFNISKIIHKGKIISAGALPEKASQSQHHPGLEVVCGDWKVTVTGIVFLWYIQALLSTVKFGSPIAISTQIINNSKTVFV